LSALNRIFESYAACDSGGMEVDMTVDVWPVISAVITLFVIMLIGVVGRMTGILDWKTTKKLSTILIKITQPMLIIYSMQIGYTDERLRIGLGIVGASAVVHIAATVLAALIFGKYPSKQSKVYQMGVIFANCAFIGFPLLEVLFPEEGLFYGAFYTFFFNVYIWTYGTFLLSRGTDKNYNPLKSLVNVGTISCAISFILFITKIALPIPILKGVEMVGHMTFPLAMLIIGSLICNSGLKKLFTGVDGYFYSAIKLLLIPILTLLICVIFKVDQGLTLLLVTMTAVPSAANNAIFAEIYNADATLSAKLVGLSTLLSVATIPLMLLLTTWILSLVNP